MTKRDHYTGRDIAKSTLTKKVAVNAAAILFSHRINNIAGSYVVVKIDQNGDLSDWESFDSIDFAERVMDALQANLTSNVS